MDQKRLEAIERENKAKKAFEEEEFEITGRQLEVVASLLEKAPRSTVINIGVTTDAVHFIDKAETVVTKLHEITFGKQEQTHGVEASLLRVFRNLDNRITELTRQFEELGRREPKQPVVIVTPQEVNEAEEDKPIPNPNTSKAFLAHHRWTIEEEDIIWDRYLDKGNLNSDDIKELAGELGITSQKVSSKYYELKKKRG